MVDINPLVDQAPIVLSSDDDAPIFGRTSILISSDDEDLSSPNDPCRHDPVAKNLLRRTNCQPIPRVIESVASAQFSKDAIEISDDEKDCLSSPPSLEERVDLKNCLLGDVQPLGDPASKKLWRGNKRLHRNRQGEETYLDWKLGIAVDPNQASNWCVPDRFSVLRLFQSQRASQARQPSVPKVRCYRRCNQQRPLSLPAAANIRSNQR